MDRVLETLKEGMFLLRSTQNLLKVFLSASALHRVGPGFAFLSRFALEYGITV